MEETGYELVEIRPYNSNRGDYTIIEKNQEEGIRISLINSKEGPLHEKILSWDEVIAKAVE